MRPIVVCAIAVLAAAAFGQELERWIEESQSPEDLQAWLDDLRQKPLDLNKASFDQIAALPFFDHYATECVIEHRSKRGFLSAVDDVLADPRLNPSQRRVLREFTFAASASPIEPRVHARATGGSISLPEGNWDDSWLRLRVRSRGPRSAGFVDVRHDVNSTEWVKPGSAGIEFTEPRAGLRMVVGDFQWDVGTGLVSTSAYGTAHWLESSDIYQPQPTKGIASRPSTRSLSTYRGVAGELRRSSTRLTLLGSWNRLDAVEGAEGPQSISGEETGSAELDRARDERIEERLAGFALESDLRAVKFGINGCHAAYSPRLDPAAGSSVPFFGGDQLSVGSAYLRGDHRDLGWVAEVAASRPGGRAFQSAFFARRERLELTAYHAHSDADFFSPRSGAWGQFGAAAGNLDLTGVRFRALAKRYSAAVGAWSESTLFRTPRSPLRASAGGFDARTQLVPSPEIQIDVLAGRRWHEDAAETTPARPVRVDRARVELTVAGREEYGLRLEVRASDDQGSNSRDLGTLLFAQMKTVVRGVHAFARVTFFDFESDEVAAATYENTLAGAYPLVFLSGSGRRVTIVLTRRLGKAGLGVKVSHMSRQLTEARHEATELALGFSYSP